MKDKPGPLSGLNILDFTWVIAGPHATRTFADMGANVLKIEHFKNGTNERHQALQVEKGGVTQSSYHLNLNRGKKSLCINLKHPKGIEVVHELIKKSDVMVENFAPGVMKRLRLDYDAVKRIKPDIIYCSITAFGHWGTNYNRPGYDLIAQGASGWLGLSATNTPAPIAIGDTTAAIHACTAILAALYHRMISGQGQNIDISLVDCLFTLHDTSFPSYWISEAAGQPPFVMPAVVNRSPTTAPYGVYKGRNGSIVIALMSQNRWPDLVALMGPEYSWLENDPRTRDVASRCRNAFIVHDALEAWVLSQDSIEEAERRLEAAGIPCSRVKSIPELATTDPLLGTRKMRVEEMQPFLGAVKMYGSPLKFSETPAGVRGYAPFLGEHNMEVLQKLLGYTQGKIEDLYAEDVLYHAPEVERLPDELKRMAQGARDGNSCMPG